jgi:hypothetical protein
MLCIIDYIDEDMIALGEAQGGPRQRTINNTLVRKALQGMYTELRGKQSGAMTCSLISNVTKVTPQTTLIQPSTTRNSRENMLAQEKE